MTFIINVWLHKPYTMTYMLYV